MAPTWVLADAHAGQDPEVDRELFIVFDHARRHRVKLLILGDLFSAWLGPSRFHTPMQARLLDELRRLRQAGGHVRFVGGNRDYLPEAQLGHAFDEVLVSGTVTSVGGQRCLVHHGDGLDPADWSYRRWRGVSRSEPAQMLLGALPGRWGRNLAHRTEAALAKTNTKYKSKPPPTDSLAALAKKAARCGATRVLVGHFHRDERHPFDDGVEVVLAPAFADQKRLLLVSGDQLLSVTAAELFRAEKGP